MPRFIQGPPHSMGHDLAFHFVPSDGPLYKWDARCKWMSFLVMSIAVMTMSYGGLLVTTLVISATLALHRKVLRSFRLPSTWWYLLALIFIMNAVDFSWSELTLITDREKIVRGFTVCWKILVLITMALIVTATTRPSQTVRALNSLLSFLPLRWNHRLTTMISLTIRFVPYLFGEYVKVAVAAYARTNSTSVKLLVRNVIPAFIRRTLIAADDIAMALQARGYRETLPIKPWPMKKRDIFTLMLFYAFVIFTCAFDYFTRNHTPW